MLLFFYPLFFVKKNMMIKNKNLLTTLCVFFLFSGSLFSQAPLPPSVLVIGHGFMGTNHVKNLETLQKENAVQIIGVVDIDKNRLDSLNYPTFLSTKEALSQLCPDIVVIATNTKEHFDVLKTIFQSGQHPALFVEKPLVETSAQTDEIMTFLKDRQSVLTSGYLFRHSPIVGYAINYLNSHHFTVEKIQVRWQKKRAPTRPSAGVHIDEATHPVDLILNQLLPALDIPNQPISIQCLSRKYNDSIVDQAQQALLYQENHEKLIPLAEVEFEIFTPTLPIRVFSSFLQPPQIREIVLHCSSETTLLLNFDKDQTDQLEIRSAQGMETIVFEKPNKLLTEWRAFLDYYHTGTTSRSIPSFEEMRTDILITEMLDEILLDQETQLFTMTNEVLPND